MVREVFVGVLALQGGFAEHVSQVQSLRIAVREVRNPTDLEGITHLILPGGESTTLSYLLDTSHLREAILVFAKQGGKIYGTCAGAIVLARNVIGHNAEKVQSLGLIPLTISRNAYGRQLGSFQQKIDIPSWGMIDVPGVFIRAPLITEVYEGGEIFAGSEDQIWMVGYQNILVSTFHPELTEDTRIHHYFLTQF